MLFIKDTPFPDIFYDNDDEDHLFQGDIIKKEAIPITENAILGFLILSNSCDLNELKKKEFISISPIFPFSITFNNMLNKAFNQTRSEIKKIKNNSGNIEKFDYFDFMLNKLSNYIKEEANYIKKYTFFLSPLKEFKNNPSIANLENIVSISKTHSKILIKNRIKSIKPPWCEKLGYKVGYLFNRVATYTPDIKNIKRWSKEIYKEVLNDKAEEIKELIKDLFK